MAFKYQGELSTVPFPELFYFLCEARRTGVLNLLDPKTSQTRRRILIKEGEGFFVQGGTLNETLGRLLVKWGKLTPEKYEEIIQIQTSTKKRTGDILLEMGLLTAQELGDSILKQVEEKIQACFPVDAGKYTFFETPPPPESQITYYHLKPERIVLNGVRSFISLERLDKLLTPLKSVSLKRNMNFTLKQAKFGFKPQETRFLMAIRDGATVEALSKISKLELQQTLQIMYVLKATGLIGPELEILERNEQLKAINANDKARAQSTQAVQQTQPAQPQVNPAQVAAQPAQPVQAQPQDVAVGQPGTQQAQPPQEPGQAEPDDDGGGMDSMFGIEGEDTVEEVQAPQKTQAEIKAEAKAKAREEARLQAEREKEAEERKKEIKAEIDKYYKLIKTANYFEILGVDRGVQGAPLKKVYFKLAKIFHPDANPEFFQGEFKDAAEEIFTKISEAYNVLSNKQLRDDYIYSLDHKISKEDLEKANKQLKAETEYSKAEILLRKGDFKGALGYIDAALKMNPDEPEYYLGLGWATFKASRGQNADAAKGHINKAFKMNLRSSLDMAHYYLGVIAKSQGDNAALETHFRKALEYRSDFPEVVSELRLLERRKQKGK